MQAVQHRHPTRHSLNRPKPERGIETLRFQVCEISPDGLNRPKPERGIETAPEVAKNLSVMWV